ncbi:MAG: MerR family transcriptional regulator [Hungatella sp.]|nr:MerR family transcriptional regulator [Hungatella sp.]
MRFYPREGLFPSIERAPNDTRLFNEENIETFYVIECMKRRGMTISQIRQYMVSYLEMTGTPMLQLKAIKAKIFLQRGQKL